MKKISSIKQKDLETRISLPCTSIDFKRTGGESIVNNTALGISPLS